MLTTSQNNIRYQKQDDFPKGIDINAPRDRKGPKGMGSLRDFFLSEYQK
jgi:hypothetical protein